MWPPRDQLQGVSWFIDSLSDSALYNYMASRGGYAPNADFQLMVSNDRSYPITVINMNVAKKECQAPLRGTLLYSADAGGDDIGSTGLGFNLDSSNTAAQLAPGPAVSSWTPDYLANHHVVLPAGASHIFDIRTVASDHACTFFYQVTVLDAHGRCRNAWGITASHSA
jgi:hypothetical protein